VERFLPIADYGEGIKPRPQESSGLMRPAISKCLPNSGQVTISSSPNPDLATGYIPFYPLPLARKTL